MKKSPVLFAALALCSSVCAQKAPPQIQVVLPGTHPRPKLAAVVPAHKPLVLHTGRPITPVEKTQFLASLVRTAHTASPAGNAARPAVRQQQQQQQSAQSAQPVPSVVTLSPDLMYVNNVVSLAVQGCDTVDPADGLIRMEPGLPSNLVFTVNVKPNTAYMLAFKVYLPTASAQNMINGQNVASSGPVQFTVWNGPSNPSPSNPAINLQTFNVNQGENEFVYGFDSTSTGQIPVLMYANTWWTFESAEFTSAAF
jgi:hypothetical protein